jgi:hypothetical protein
MCFFCSKRIWKKVRAENLRRKLGFGHSIIFESDGQSGGLLMLWRDNVRISIKGVTKNYIDVVIEGYFSWRFTGVYGEPSWGQKHITWDALRTLHGQLNLPWLALVTSQDFSKFWGNFFVFLFCLC